MLTVNPDPEASSLPYLFRHHLERRGTFGDFLKSVFRADTQPPPTIIREGRNLNQPKDGQQIVFNQPIDSAKSGERHPEPRFFLVTKLKLYFYFYRLLFDHVNLFHH
jgi:hypothetical protein